MNRMTSDNTFEMNMHQLALNQVYIGQDGWAQYREYPEHERSVCDLIRSAAETLGVELPILSDGDLSDLLTDWLQYGEEEPEGILAVLYRALWAMAEVRTRLSTYEGTGLEPEEISQLTAPVPNDPLTLEELWEMDGEPVWLVTNKDRPQWAFVIIDHEEFISFNCADGTEWEFDLYGDNDGVEWLAYRRKPEAADER